MRRRSTSAVCGRPAGHQPDPISGRGTLPQRGRIHQHGRTGWLTGVAPASISFSRLARTCSQLGLVCRGGRLGFLDSLVGDRMSLHGTAQIGELVGHERGFGDGSQHADSRFACGCRKPRPRQATRRYSLIVPPTRVCLRMRYCSRSTGSGSGFSGAAPCRER